VIWDSVVSRAESGCLELPTARWRLLGGACQNGATNMATDEAVVLGVAERHSLPTLRFYGWNPPCVSIGYAQSLLGEIDLDSCRAKGYGWVRRPTGGRAVLHVDELTYSVVAPLGDPRVSGDIVTSYRKISEGLLAGLRLLGCQAVQAERRGSAGGGDESAACFEVPSHYEVTALGRKLVGSAQVRRRGVVLQHGALPLEGDVGRLADVLAVPDDQRARIRERLRQRAIALDEALQRSVSFAQVAEALAKGFAQALDLELLPGEFTHEEEDNLQRLEVLYSGQQWTLSR
jgi:lipoate-protein ligase A